MMGQYKWLMTLCAIGGLALCGCDGGSNDFVPSASPEGDEAVSDGGEGVEATSPSDSASTTVEGGGESAVDEVSQDGDAFPPITDFENGCSESVDDCGAGFSCASAGGIGACTVSPDVETSLSDPFSQEKDESASPNFECVNTYPDPAESTTVTAYGVMDRFGAGLVTDNILVRVFLAEDFNPWKCDSLELEEKTSCLAELVDDETIIVAETVAKAVSEVKGMACETDQDCPKEYSCTGDLDGECFLNFGTYELPGLPTNVPLVVMTRPVDEEAAGDWHSTFMYDVVLVQDYVEQDLYRFDPLIVGHGQWKIVPNPFFTTIKLGNGAIGGRIRDCGLTGAEGRSAWNLGEATVGFATPPGKIGYFNDKEEDSLPDPDRSSTNILGRYTGLDVPSGPNVVGASVSVDGEVISLGAVPIYVFPNSLAIVSLPGRVATFTQE